MRQTALVIVLTPEQRRTIRSWQSSPYVPYGEAKRGRLLLLLSEGLTVTEAARRKEAQKSIAYRLHRLGWTQEETARCLGVDQTTISYDMKNGQLSDFHIPADWNEQWLEQEAERLNIPLLLMWAMALRDLDDQERLKRLGITLQPYDVWNFARCDDLYGGGWPGRIPGPSERFRCASPVRVVE
jgi:hypothetical protein